MGASRNPPLLPRGNGEAASENEPVSYRLETSPMHGCVGLVRRVKYSAFPSGFASDILLDRGKADNRRRVDASLGRKTFTFAYLGILL